MPLHYQLQLYLLQLLHHHLHLLLLMVVVHHLGLQRLLVHHHLLHHHRLLMHQHLLLMLYHAVVRHLPDLQNLFASRWNIWDSRIQSAGIIDLSSGDSYKLP